MQTLILVQACHATAAINAFKCLYFVKCHKIKGVLISACNNFKCKSNFITHYINILHTYCCIPSIGFHSSNETFIRGNPITQTSGDILIIIISTHITAWFTTDIIITVFFICHPYHKLLATGSWIRSKYIICLIKGCSVKELK